MAKKYDHPDAKPADYLTLKQETYCIEYCLQRHGIKAAKAAGYKGDSKQLSVVSSANLRKPRIQRRIAEIMSASVMPRIEAMDRLSQIARAEYSIAIKPDGEIDMKMLDKLNLLHLVKGISPTRYGDRIEFYDAQAALVHILKVYDAIGESGDVPKINVVKINVPS